MEAGFGGFRSVREAGRGQTPRITDPREREDADIRIHMADRFHRRSIRLRGYDHTRAGAYYVTVCTHDRMPLFGDVVNGVMVPNAMGHIVQRCWDAIPDHMPMVVCDAFVVMPNHVHGIIVITDVASGQPVRRPGRDPVGAANSPPLPPRHRPTIHPPPPDVPDIPRRPPIAIMVPNSLGHIMQTFKAAVTRQAMRDGLIPRGTPVFTLSLSKGGNAIIGTASSAMTL